MKDEKKQKQKASKSSTQTHLPIAEIKEGTVILKDGTMRAVLLTSSINFALKTEEEQEALISSYVSFLNSLEFPVQIVVQSRRLQIKSYLEKLLKLEKEQTNELLRAQMADYRAFIAEFVEIGEIMTKRFFVVVPFDPMSNRQKSFWSRFKEVLHPAVTVRLKEERFQKRKGDLDSRIRQVVGGLQGIGLEVVQMDTQSLIELYYSSYNPDISFAEELQPVNELQIESI